MSSGKIRFSLLTFAAATASLVMVAAPVTGHADTTQTECQLVQGPLPGANIVVGPVQESVPSISNLNVCVTVDVVTAGVPLPQFPGNCGSPCFIIATDGVTAGAITTISATWIDNGTTPDGTSYTVPAVGGVQEPVCVAVGSPAPSCQGARAAFNLGLVSFGA